MIKKSNPKSKIAVIILAAGRGARMKSQNPKALCELSGKAMVEFLIDTAKSCEASEIVVVGGYKIELLRERLSKYNIKIIRQKQLLGSADAVKQAKACLGNFNGIVLVLYADTPLIKTDTIKAMLRQHRRSKPSVTLLTTMACDGKDYGRISRDSNGNINAIVEYLDLEQTQFAAGRTQDEINVGAYCFDSKKLFEGLKHIRKNKKKQEFYLTDIISYCYEKKYSIASYITRDSSEALGINRRRDLALAEQVLNKRVTNEFLDSGVTIKDPSNTYIEAGAKIGVDTVIHPYVVIEGGVIIGKNCSIGPFAHLRKGTVLKDESSIGNFVEVVRSTFKEQSKAKHHSYIGDAVIGKRVNIGAGTITANYDGKAKNKTIVDDDAFIGSGTTIVAPVKIGRRAITGAGSVVVKGRDVAPNTTVVGVPARPIIKKR